GEAVCLVAGWMHKSIERREDVRHVAARPGKADAVVQSRLARAPLPVRQLGAPADDEQIGVPVLAPTQPDPGIEQRVEALAAIAERTDESNQGTIGPRSQRTLRVHTV